MNSRAKRLSYRFPPLYARPVASLRLLRLSAHLQHTAGNLPGSQQAAPHSVEAQVIPYHAGLLQQTLLEVPTEGWEQVCVLGVDDMDAQIEVEA